LQAGFLVADCCRASDFDWNRVNYDWYVPRGGKAGDCLMPQPTEFDLQRALCGWLDGWPDRNGIPKAKPALAPRVVYFHVPNGGDRDLREAKRLKQSGVKAGVPDILFLAHQRFYCLELKEPGGNGRLSPAQLAMHPRLIDAGATALATLDNLAEAKAWCVANFLAIEC
jgi:hypothetical protein